MRNAIPDGKHILTGVCEINVACGYDGEDITDGLCLTIDGKNYIAYSDPDDGYRSYGCFYQDEKYVQRNLFPGQDVLVECHEWNDIDENGYESIGDEILILNADIRKEILSCGTIRDDAYYPCGYWYFYPENMPVNKKRKDESECRVPSQSDVAVDDDVIDIEPVCDDDADDGYDDYCKACSFLKDVKVDTTFWQCFEHLVRDSVKRKFERWLEKDFEKYDTDELLSLWEEFSKNFKS